MLHISGGTQSGSISDGRCQKGKLNIFGRYLNGLLSMRKSSDSTLRPPWSYSSYPQFLPLLFVMSFFGSLLTAHEHEWVLNNRSTMNLTALQLSCTALSLHDWPVQHLNHCRRCPNPPVSLPLSSTVTQERNPVMLQLLHLRLQLTPSLKWKSKVFRLRTVASDLEVIVNSKFF